MGGERREEESAPKNNSDEVDDDGFSTVPATGKKAGGRYVPPSERNQGLLMNLYSSLWSFNI